jgi:hypothetical protein
MITYRNWEDLQKEGIELLTGEACGYMMRLLCDVNARGMELLCRLFECENLGDPLNVRKRAAKDALQKLAAATVIESVPPEQRLNYVTPENDRAFAQVDSFLDSLQGMALRAAWNGRDGAEWSIMLPREMYTPLAVMACFRANCSVVYVMYDGHVHGVEASDKPEDIEQFVKWNQGKHCDACNRYGAGGGINYRYTNPGFDRNRHAMSGRTR